MEKNLKKLDIKDGDELIVYDNEALEQLQKSQNSTIITIIPEKGDSIKLIMKDEETMKDATRKALQQATPSRKPSVLSTRWCPRMRMHDTRMTT